MYIKIVFLFSIRDLRANITTNIFSLFFSSFIPEPFLPISSLYAVFLAERLRFPSVRTSWGKHISCTRAQGLETHLSNVDLRIISHLPAIQLKLVLWNFKRTLSLYIVTISQKDKAYLRPISCDYNIHEAQPHSTRFLASLIVSVY